MSTHNDLIRMPKVSMSVVFVHVHVQLVTTWSGCSLSISPLTLSFSLTWSRPSPLLSSPLNLFSSSGPLDDGADDGSEA